ncbi:RNA polymerase sigma-70 factor [Sphingobacterium faecium NBRC 15299]|uniref:RNA polymerase sigma factor n=1 Tax=Sphingobacterium faecium TaxID=34087 RepID=UPI000D35FD94|nr:sigma-70 family RNA polymerase sigma factor [Sphingobacterium faecium]PTX07227.1 RNA polymerase sigma-70 factor (ECF subfamily) [Sphingobacterium faecium]GEM65734.1 RNA polymerase sigma-70 factor [Sphingobacterium faecium NBRC 15299]
MKNEHVWHSKESLLERLKLGDLEAFNMIYEQYWSVLINESYKRLHNMALCEEVVQDVFIDLWQQRAVREIQNLEAYLRTCMKFKVFEIYRKNRRTKSMLEENLSLMQEHEISEYDQYAEKDLKSLIQEWIAHLPQKRKEIFKMRYLDELSTKEISEMTESSQNTVQNHLGISIAKLRKLIIQHFLLFILTLFH